MRSCYNFLVLLLVIIAIKDSVTKYLLVDIERNERVEAERVTKKILKCMICSGLGPTGKCRDENDIGIKRECPDEDYNTCFKLTRPRPGYPPGTKEILRGCKYDKLSGSVCYPEDVDKCEGVGSNVVCEKLCLCSGDYCNGSEIDILDEQTN